MREVLLSREVIWTVVGGLIGFAYNRAGLAFGST